MILILTAAVLILLIGCTRNKTVTADTQGPAYTAQVEWNKQTLICQLSFEKQDLLVLVTEPQEIAGLKYVLSESGGTIEFEGIKYKIPKDSKSPIGFVNVLKDILISCNGKNTQKDGDNFVMSGENNGYSWRMILNEKGCPKQLTSDDLKLKVTFK